MELSERLLNIKKKYSQRQTEKDRIAGQIEYLENELKKETDEKSIDKIKRKLKKLIIKNEKDKKELKKKIRKIEEQI